MLAKFLLSVFVVFVISVLPLQIFVKSVIGFVAEPISYWTNEISQSTNSSLYSIGEVFSLRESYNALKVEKAKLEAENSTVALLSDENVALKQQLNLGKNDISQLQVEVVSGGVYGQSEYLVINKGRKDGINTGQKAVIGNILVGIVGEVNEASAKVILPFSRNMNLKVKVVTGNLEAVKTDDLAAESKDLAYANGVTKGTINGIVVENIAQTYDVKVGQSVIADDEKIGRYLLIGRVSKVEQKESDPTKKAEVEPLVGYYDLRYLFIEL